MRPLKDVPRAASFLLLRRREKKTACDAEPEQEQEKLPSSSSSEKTTTTKVKTTTAAERRNSRRRHFPRRPRRGGAAAAAEVLRRRWRSRNPRRAPLLMRRSLSLRALCLSRGAEPPSRERSGGVKRKSWEKKRVMLAKTTATALFFFRARLVRAPLPTKKKRYPFLSRARDPAKGRSKK